MLKERFGLNVIVAAADTYRAAAIEQLETWAERAGTEIVKGNAGRRSRARWSSMRSPPPRPAAPTS